MSAILKLAPSISPLMSTNAFACCLRSALSSVLRCSAAFSSSFWCLHSVCASLYCCVRSSILLSADTCSVLMRMASSRRDVSPQSARCARCTPKVVAADLICCCTGARVPVGATERMNGPARLGAAVAGATRLATLRCAIVAGVVAACMAGLDASTRCLSIPPCCISCARADAGRATTQGGARGTVLIRLWGRAHSSAPPRPSANKCPCHDCACEKKQPA